MSGIGAVVTDIEGTTSSIAFVREVLFPYARRALPGFLQEHHDRPDVAQWLRRVAEETQQSADDLDGITETLLAWIDADRKHTALKALQGMVWADGYGRADFRAHIYPDAAAALRRYQENAAYDARVRLARVEASAEPWGDAMEDAYFSAFDDAEVLAHLAAENAYKDAMLAPLRPLEVMVISPSQRIDVIVNLTIPSTHYSVSMDIVSAGKHAYSEKPFVLSLDSFWPVAIMMGVVMAGHQGFSLSIFSTITDVVPNAKVGRVTAFGAFMGNMGGVAISLITGRVLDAGFGFVPLFIFAASSYLVALAWFQWLLPVIRRPEEEAVDLLA